MGPWKQVCSCTSPGVAAGSLCLRGIFSVHQSGLCLPSPVPMVTGHRAGWGALDSTSPVIVLCCTLRREELGWWTPCPCLMPMAAEVSQQQFILSLPHLQGCACSAMERCLGKLLNGNPGTCGTTAAEAVASIRGLALFQVSWGLRWMLEAVQFGWG